MSLQPLIRGAKVIIVIFYFVGRTTFSESKNEDEEDKFIAELLLTMGKMNHALTRLETGQLVQM